MALLLILLLVCMVSPAAGAGDVSLSGGQAARAQAVQESGRSPSSLAGPVISLEYKTVEPGKAFEYPVMLYNIDNIANMDIRVRLAEPTTGAGACFLKCTNVNKGSFLENALFDSRIEQDSAGGSCGQTVRVSFASSGGLKGSGPAASLSCSVEKPPAGWYADTQPFVETASTGTGAAVTVAEAGGYIFIGTPPKGDCDGDGFASTRDALMAIQMSVGKQETDLTCDVNSDGKVNSADARELLKYAQSGGADGESVLKTGALAGGPGSGSAASGGEIAPIPLPNPQNIGVGGKGSEQRGATPITIPRVADKTGGKGVAPIPIP
jgi:hypothetical protein